jgi:hypothetical protein
VSTEKIWRIMEKERFAKAEEWDALSEILGAREEK